MIQFDYCNMFQTGWVNHQPQMVVSHVVVRPPSRPLRSLGGAVINLFKPLLSDETDPKQNVVCKIWWQLGIRTSESTRPRFMWKWGPRGELATGTSTAAALSGGVPGGSKGILERSQEDKSGSHHIPYAQCMVYVLIICTYIHIPSV